MILIAFLMMVETHIPEFGAGACSAKSSQHLVGKLATARRVSIAKSRSNAKVVRKHRFDQPVTQDYRTDRVNVVTDKRNVIRRISCG